MPAYIPVSNDAYQLFHDGQVAFAAVERNGCRIDVPYLRAAIAEVEKYLAEMEVGLQQTAEYATGRKVFGTSFNLDSAKQLAQILYKEHGHVVTTLDGEVLTNVDEYALTKVGSEFAKMLLKLRKYKKLLGTYLKPILELQFNGYLHCSLNLNTVITYRSSCEDPNLQNIPARDKEIARLIRRAFIASDGFLIMECDLKGAEVSVSACYHHDPTMIAYLKNPSSDMHRDVAKRCFFLDNVPKAVRQATKGDFTFSAFYGNWWRANAQSLWDDIHMENLKTAEGMHLAQHLALNGITGLGTCKGKHTQPGTFEHHIKAVDQWFWGEQFHVYAAWKDYWWNLYLEHGGFQTLTGFRVQGCFVFNQVVNSPIQGSSFHCILWALIQLQRWLVANGKRTRIINTIHDSIILDVYIPELYEINDKIVEILTVDLPRHWEWLCVPVTAEIEVAGPGLSWFDKAPITDLVL